MAVHWITFRLANETVGGRDYSTRYAALVEAVKGHRHQGKWWHEPTSFWLVSTDASRAQLATSIRSAIAPSKDLVLIGSMESTGATLVGTASELSTLKALVPNLSQA